MTEKQRKERQRKAYENRDAILPRDVLLLKCTRIDDEMAWFDFPEGALGTRRHHDGNSVREPLDINVGDSVRLFCYEQSVQANGYGLFVDYTFGVEEAGEKFIINGPDAQTLERLKGGER